MHYVHNSNVYFYFYLLNYYYFVLLNILKKYDLFLLMEDILDKDIKFLAGVGPKRAELLNKELEILTFGDLLYYFPYKYVDRSKFHKTTEIHQELPHVQLTGKIIGFRIEGSKAGKRLVALFRDEHGDIELIWFRGIKWITDTLKTGTEYVVFGKPTEYNRRINLIHPEIEEKSKTESNIAYSFQAFYNTTEKLKNNFVTSRTIQKLQQNLLRVVYKEIAETLPVYLLENLKLLPLKESLLNIHFPKSAETLKKSQYRVKFEELFYIQLSILRQKVRRNTDNSGYIFSQVGEFFNRFYKENLHFELTGAQKKVMKEIRRDVNSGKQMNRLLQGDVGSGKTLVALMSMLLAVDNGFQACLMVPTEILAQQHFQSLLQFTSNLGIEIKLLTGSTRKKEREIIHEGLRKGDLKLMVGTHALIEDEVQFQKLGLVVIDEQHRFGVAQRAKLWQKSESPPHILVMTATPIPRTLAMTVYGDLDVSVIDEMPPGRKPIITAHYTDAKRLKLFGFLRKQISEGRQVYIVYPLIRESEKMDYKDLEDGYESISRAFPPPEYAVSIVHGKMKPAEKDIAMDYFKRGQTHIMVATTVIEVGVDVPNASVMVIESAERFGLSQLHQLRGRVGRGANQSYCILMTSHKLSKEARQRIQIMVNSNDGFEIAEMDLLLRGPGDLEGTQQSGVPFKLKLANLGKDNRLLQYARDIASKVLERDPLLEKEENGILKDELKKNFTGNKWWGQIS